MKKIIFTMLLVLFSISMAACSSSKTADEKKIRADLESGETIHFLDSGEQITELVINDRQTDKKEKSDKVWCTVTTADEDVSCTRNIVLSYGLHDKQGWVLDAVSVEATQNWITKPLRGVTEESIAEVIIKEGTDIQIGQDDWKITQGSLTECKVEQHNTDLAGEKDTVVVAIILDDAVEQAEGQLTLEFSFHKKWMLKSVSGEDTFTITEKAERMHQFTDEEIISKLQNYEVQVGQPKDQMFYSASDIRTLTIHRDEISDLAIGEERSYEKGTRKEYSITCTWNKQYAVFRLDAVIQYCYNVAGWDGQVVSCNPVVQSFVGLEGEWSGVYTAAPYGGKSVLNITSVEEDGTITAVYSFTPDTIDRYSQPGSYQVSGNIDTDTFTVNLKAGEWVQKPSRALSTTKSDISGKLLIEEGEMTGLAQEGAVFKIKKDDAE